MSSPDRLVEPFRSRVLDLTTPSRVAVVGHSDVDGLAATVIITRAFKRLGHSVWPYVTKKSENAWSESVLALAASHQPDLLVVVDLGSRSDPLLSGVPVILIDHHKPTGVPAGGLLISGYDLEPTPSSGLLAFWCAQSVGVERDLDWLAAASMLADYGSTSLFPETRAGAKSAGAKTLRQITTLLNAPRRTSEGDANAALQMLLRVPDAAGVLDSAAGQVLLAAKQEVDEALQRARKAPPKFSGDVALILIDEACQVHPLVAQTWRNRLPKQIVLCANKGYLPGRINFSMRTARPDNLIHFLQKHKPSGAGDDYGRGHNKATGGSLTLAQWDEFVRSLGFSL